ncbi:hypothetical protein N1F78_04800 [Seonamhaeicola sp. MEBiC1930]|uniref:hypothetical protein n=1 Tax=Seonamhaeicola sp. MEBiC01930 TaxID=2976768 RepID=UPI00324538F1
MSRKQALIRIIPVVILLFFVIYSIKKSSYNKGVEFYENNFNAIIKSFEKSKVTRGTKVFYSDDDVYFYLENYEGVSLKVGDSIIKSGQEIQVFRKANKVSGYELLGDGNPIKPLESFWDYFLF